jgi:hypothetical protein
MRTHGPKGLDARLVRLEEIVPAGCDHCRTWYGVTLGNEDGSTMRPERCPGCGRHVPITLVHIVVGVAWEVI